MPERTRQANAEKSRVRSCIEHVFAAQKSRMGLFVRTTGIARATAKIGMANLVYNLKRVLFLLQAAVAPQSHDQGRFAGVSEGLAVCRHASIAIDGSIWRCCARHRPL